MLYSYVSLRLEQVKKELADMKKTQIDQARQTHKVCIVLSGNDVRFWPRNEMKCFVDTCYKVFGVRVGYLDLQVRDFVKSIINSQI